MTSATKDEDKYTLVYFPQGVRDGGDDEPPFKYRTFYLDDALAEAWRIAHGGGSALRIIQRDETSLDKAALKELLDKMSELEGEQSGRGERELAALALGGSGDADTKSKKLAEGSGEIESPS